MAEWIEVPFRRTDVLTRAARVPLLRFTADGAHEFVPVFLFQVLLTGRTPARAVVLNAWLCALALWCQMAVVCGAERLCSAWAQCPNAACNTRRPHALPMLGAKASTTAKAGWTNTLATTAENEPGHTPIDSHFRCGAGASSPPREAETFAKMVRGSRTRRTVEKKKRSNQRR